MQSKKNTWPSDPAKLTDAQRNAIDKAFEEKGGKLIETAKRLKIKLVLLDDYVRRDALIKEGHRAGALIGQGGIVGNAAKTVGIARESLHRHISKSERLKDARLKGENSIGDIAESKMVELIQKGDGQMIRYYLDRRCKDRGYVRRNEVTGENGAPIAVAEVQFIMPDNDRDENSQTS